MTHQFPTRSAPPAIMASTAKYTNASVLQPIGAKWQGIVLQRGGETVRVRRIGRTVGSPAPGLNFCCRCKNRLPASGKSAISSTWNAGISRIASNGPSDLKKIKLS